MACRHSRGVKITRKVVIGDLNEPNYAGTLLACSDFIMPGVDPVVSARTMDFEMNQYNAAVFVPRKLHWTSHAPWWGVIVQDGVKWKNKYGFVGIDLFGGVEWIQKILGGRKYSDGMNEAGLSAAVLWLDATKFSEVKKAEMGLSARDLISYTLGRFGTVADVKKGFSPATVTVWDEDLLDQLHFTLHLVVHDKDGKSLVIEWVNGKPPQMYDDNNGTNQYKGVLTNDPTYPDMKTYLEGFKLTNKDSKDPTTGDYIEGSGLKTLPTIPVRPEDEGSNGDMYVFARMRSGRTYYWNGKAWIHAGENLKILPCRQGKLSTRHFLVLQDEPADERWAGASIYAGYGENVAEMFLTGQYDRVVVIQ